MNLCRLMLSAAAVLVCGAALLSVQVSGQAPPPVPTPAPALEPAGTSTLVEAQAGPDGTFTLVERTPDGRILRTTKTQPSGVQAVQYAPANAANAFVPLTTPDGRTTYAYSHSPFAQDAESQKLYAQEQAAAQEVRTLAAQAQQGSSEGDRADAKKKLRDKLAQIFDLQQQRRTHEIAKIEERLAKLKDTLKKRETAKDSIVDRRVETLTGGVDELGWEDTLGGHATPYGPRTTSPVYPEPPRYAPAPGYGAPGTTPAPPSLGPVPPALPAPAVPPRAAR